MSQTHGTTVFEMVRQVVDETRKKLADDASSGVDKTAAVRNHKPAAQMEKLAGNFSRDDLLKIADACEYLSENFHVVIDDRSPQEKLAEYAAIHDAIKVAVEGSDPPKTVSLDSSGTGVGGSNAIPSEATNTPGTSLDAGESGSATPAHQSPKSVEPNEKANPQDAANALETNKEMMMADMPEDVLKQSMVNKMSNAFKKHAKAQVRREAITLLKKAAKSGVPTDVAIALLRQTRGDAFAKVAEDAINPAQISGGTEPALQSEPGVPSALSQGSEVGSNTPRQTAPSSGEASGRQFISSNESAINATKGEAHTQNARAALSELLAEPALSSQHDTVLQQSLDNTSSAGVKISAARVVAAREMLRKFAASSPVNAKKLGALLKLATDPELAAAMAGGEEAPGMEAPSDEAMEAAHAGVTPEELAQAEELLSAQAEQAEMAEQALAAEAEKASQAVPSPAPVPAAAPVAGAGASPAGPMPPTAPAAGAAGGAAGAPPPAQM